MQKITPIKRKMGSSQNHGYGRWRTEFRARAATPKYAAELTLGGCHSLTTAAAGTSLCSPHCPHQYWPLGATINGTAASVPV